jgi:two-component system sensor histidine kinase DegS
MSGSERLDELNSAALAIINDCEGQVLDLERRVEELRSRIDIERRQVSNALDELTARYYDLSRASAGGTKPARNSPLNLDQIKAMERALGEQLLGCATLSSKLNSLSNLLAVSRGQFTTQTETTDEPDVWKLVERIAMLKAQEQERSRLAREVHDGPAQVLANVILGLELCEQIARRSPEQLIDELARLKSTMREGLIEVRRFQFDLRPSSLADRGLMSTLQRYVTDYQAFFRLSVELQLPEQAPSLSKDEELQTFRIIQEALQNIQKHARATLVTVQITTEEDAVVVTIQDNGRGFVQHQNEITTLSGAGLRGMKERAAAVGGELEVSSNPGAGTTIRFSLPQAVTVEEGAKV